MRSDRFTAGTLADALVGSGLSDIRFYSSCASTNDEAKRMFVEGQSAPALLAAAEQTAGRGRMGRQFLSPAGSGVYFSLLCPLSAPPASVLYATCAAGVAVRRAVLSATGCDTRIKWVNDLRFCGKKVCGILAEAVSLGDRHALVIGVGINLRPAAFPPELDAIAGSLGNTDCPRAVLVAACTKELLQILRAPDGAWLDEYRAASCTLGQRVRILRDGVELQRGTALDIRPDGALLLRLADGSILPVTTGEVSLLEE